MIEIDPEHEEFVERFIRENLPESDRREPLKSQSQYRAEIDAVTKELDDARSRIAELEEYIAGLECIDRRGSYGRPR